MGAQIAAPAAAGVIVAIGLILIGLERWWSARQTSRQRLARFSSAPAAEARAEPRERQGPSRIGARLAQAVGAHQDTAALGVLAAAALVASLLAGAVETGVVVAAGLAVLALWQLGWENARRRERLEKQLGPAVRSMAAAIESGYNIEQAIQRVARDGGPPLSDEFARVVRATQLGVSMESALADLAARVRSNDFDFFATIVSIQYRLGGHLGTLLLGLATSIQERLEFRAQVHALTAQPRYSGRVLIVLPLVSLLAVYVFRREYLSPLLETTLGHLVLGFAAVMLFAGVASIRALSQVKV